MSAAAGGIHGEVLGAIASIWGPAVLHHSSSVWKTFSSLSSLSPAATPRQSVNALCPPWTPPPFKWQSNAQIEPLVTAPD